MINCPIVNYNTYPTHPCYFALNTISSLKSNPHLLDDFEYIPELEDCGCEWYVIDRDSKFCFWKWINNPDNQYEHTLEEVSQLCGIPLPTVYSFERKAYAKIRSLFKNESLEKKAPEMTDTYYLIFYLPNKYPYLPLPNNSVLPLYKYIPSLAEAQK